MRFEIISLILLIVFSIQKLNAQNRIKVNIPSVQSEAEYVWSTLKDIGFFEKNNYQVSLPKGELIEKLKIKAKEESLDQRDYLDLEMFIRDSVYCKSNYEKGYQKIQEELPLANQMLTQIQNLKVNWDYKEFEVYQINLTLYGPGGSYNTEDGSVLIYTTTDGRFKGYDNPLNTIIHEIIHIGIEESIVSKYNVPHRMKERIVDNFVALLFKNNLPEYWIQEMGDNRIDRYLKTKEDLKNLDKHITEALNEN